MPGSFPTFEKFSTAIHGRAPFPWQARLAGSVAEGQWPEQIGVPTGLGKSTCIEIAVWALASQGARPPAQRTAATRVYYVVNRRLLVDAAFDLALSLSALLRDPGSITDVRPEATTADITTITAVADALASKAAVPSDQGPLHVVRLRGGVEAGARAPDPAQPSLILSTVPMFASRWLFSGYGASSSMRPIDAAHAGIDSLVLLDEAHLSRSLLNLAGPVRQCDPGNPALVLEGTRARPQFVALTATGHPSTSRFDLDEADTAHPVVARRLAAAKPVTLAEAPGKQLGSALAAAAVRLLDASSNPAACVVFVNTPSRASEVAKALGKTLDRRPRPTEVVVLTGQLRDREAAHVRRRLLDPATGVASGRATGARTQDLIVVATQTLEVGADLDFDFLVSETAGVRALVQRLGRLNRLGDRPWASGELIHQSDCTEWPVYGTEPAEVWSRLQATEGFEGPVELGPAVIAEVLGDPLDEDPVSGELLPAHLWAWVKTSDASDSAPSPEFFYEGFADDTRRVVLCWRACRPVDGVRLVPPTTQREGVQLPLLAARSFLDGRGIEVVQRVASDAASLESVGVSKLRPGDTVVLDPAVGGYGPHGWDGESHDVVLDVSLLDAGVLPLTTASIVNMTGAALSGELHSVLETLVRGVDEDRDPLDPTAESALVTSLIDQLRGVRPLHGVDSVEWATFLDALPDRVLRPVDDANAYLVADRRRTGAVAQVAVDAFDDLTFSASNPALAAHVGSTGEVAARMARQAGFNEELQEAARVAGELHDLGKADPRFQRWLDPQGNATELLAKSNMPWHRREAARIASGWPRGGRHEAISALLLSERLRDDAQLLGAVDRDLVHHLVLSHHGHGRPLVPPAVDDAPPGLKLEVLGEQVAITSDLAAVDWDQPARFRALCERYGYWGLALLESVLRQADHATSQISGRGVATGPDRRTADLTLEVQ